MAVGKAVATKTFLTTIQPHNITYRETTADAQVDFTTTEANAWHTKVNAQVQAQVTLHSEQNIAKTSKLTAQHGAIQTGVELGLQPIDRNSNDQFIISKAAIPEANTTAANSGQQDTIGEQANDVVAELPPGLGPSPANSPILPSDYGAPFGGVDVGASPDTDSTMTNEFVPDSETGGVRLLQDGQTGDVLHDNLGMGEYLKASLEQKLKLDQIEEDLRSGKITGEEAIKQRTEILGGAISDELAKQIDQTNPVDWESLVEDTKRSNGRPASTFPFPVFELDINGSFRYLI